MSDEKRPREDPQDDSAPGPAEEGSEATQADMGMSAGTGATAGEGTDNPRGADPQDGDETEQKE